MRDLEGRCRSPAFTPLADVSQNHTKALQALLREFVLRGRQWALFGAERLASAGRTCKAVNNHHQHFTPAKRAPARKDSDEQGEQYSRDLDAADREASSGQQPTSEELQQQIERLKARQKRARGVVEGITASGAPQRSRTDPARRAMPKSPKVEAGYTVRSAVERQHTLMGAHDVTHAATDEGQLSPLAMRAQEAPGGDRLRPVADMGADHGHERTAGDEAGSEADGPNPSTSANTTLGLLGQARGAYAPPEDRDRGPAGEELTWSVETTALGRPLRDDATAAGRRCPLQEPCPSDNAGRRIPRWGDEPSRARMEERLKANPAIMQASEPIVAPPSGSPQTRKGSGHFPHEGAQARAS